MHMDAVQLLQDKISIARIMEYYNFEFHDEGTMLRGACKIHGGKRRTSFVANTENNLWFCHTGCQQGGDAYNLVQHMEKNMSFPHAVQKIASIMGVDIANLEIKERSVQAISDMKKFLRTMKSMTTQRETHEFVLPPHRKRVTKFRSFQPETLEHFELSFVEEIELTSKDGRLYTAKNRLLLPIYDEGRCVGMSLRATNSSDYPKWSHQPQDSKTGEMLYNFDAVKGSSFVILCEGPFDVWAMHEITIPAVCTYGAHVSDEQYRMLLRSGIEDVVLAFDGDDAGRKATQKATRLFKNKMRVFKLNFDEGEDCENIPRDALKEKYNTRTRIG